MIERDEVLGFMANPRYRPMRRRELARALGADRDGYDDFRDVIDELEGDGLVTVLRGRRYALADLARTGADKRAGGDGGGGSGGGSRAPQGLSGTFCAKGGYGFVRVEDGGPDFFIGGQHTGGAMDGDRVLVSPVRGGDRGRSARRSGRIVKILERFSQEVVGILRAGPGGPFMRPGERPDGDEVEVADREARDAELPIGHKVAARIVRYPTHTRPALVEIVADLGPAGDIAAETAAVIREFGLREAFPSAAIDEAEGLPSVPPEEEIARRADLREQPCFTIDPPDAADHDDAVYLERRPDGGWRLYVHIADVSWYIRANSALDTEARTRSTSVYLPGKVLPMLPPRISSNLCSLRPGEERAAQSAIIDFGADGERLGFRIGRTVIRSSARINYGQVRRLLEGAPEPGDEVPPATVEKLREMHAFSQKLRARRAAAGALFLDVAEVRVRLGPTGETVAIEARRQDFSHQLIEEFMLAANRAVAEYLVVREVPGLFRVHEDPEDDKLRQLSELLKTYNIELKPPYERVKLQRAVEASRGKPSEDAVAFAVLTSLKQARYSAEASPHYALAFEPYCHFTSPIRRYPDLIVHRALSGLYPQGEHELPPLGPGGRRRGPRAPADDRRRSATWMESAAQLASTMERRAAEAERRLTRFRQLDFLKKSQEGVHDGTITGVAEFGIFVRLDKFLVDGLVHVERMTDRYHYNQRRQELVGMRAGQHFRPGDRVTVQVVRIDPATGRLELELAGSK